MIELNRIYNEDCLEGMKRIPDGSVDMILCDLPYGTTACSWDTIIPFEPLWEQYERVIKNNGAIVLTASQPFTSALVMSNTKNFRYQWYWNKTNVTGFANAKKQPLRNVEDILIFYKKLPTYNPQGLIKVDRRLKNSKTAGGESLRADVESSSGKGTLRTEGGEYIQEFTNYPRQTLKIKNDDGEFHPTQKPVALFEYLIKTYTNKNETVLDNCMGSGTTAIACMNTERNYIGFELDKTYYEKSLERIRNHTTQTELFDYM